MSHITNATEESPLLWGWSIIDDNLMPIWLTKDSSAIFKKTFKKCGCHSKCSKKCSCEKNNIQCLPVCKCRRNVPARRTTYSVCLSANVEEMFLREEQHTVFACLQMSKKCSCEKNNIQCLPVCKCRRKRKLSVN